MANIAPFRALRYDTTRVRPELVITQPYDKITPAMQENYYQASPYNLVRIILGKREPDEPNNNAYTRAAVFFDSWRKEQIFRQDADPSIYAYSQVFTPPGGVEKLERRGFIAVGKVEDYSAAVVFRHEQTLAKPKADRLELLRSTRAHFGQLFMLYNDSGEIESLLSFDGSPTLELTDEYGVQNRIWKISDSNVIESVRNKMRDKKLVIADGHHRYETALAYRNEQRAAFGSATPAGTAGGYAAHDYAMMTFVNMNSKGLVVLPTHRVVHSLASFSVDEFLAGARKFFNVEEVDSGVDAARCTGLLKQAGRAGTAILAITPERDFLLHTPRGMGSEIFANYSLRQQSLDVVQLHKVLLEKVLRLSEESIRNQENLSYVRDTGEVLDRVRNGDANLAFLMNPARIEQVRDIAFAGEVLPQKSTDFYPKLLTGLAIYALD